MNRIGEANASRRPTVLAVALIVACALAAYSNSFTDLFVGLDGKESIRDNPHIRHIWPLSEALSLPMWKPPINLAETPTVAHRPTFSLSLALTNHFFGVKPRAHHAVNLAIHIAAALVLFGIVRRTLGRQRFCELSIAKSTWLAWAAALIWLVHPLQTESVTYIVQRAESLMGLLFLLTVYCAIRALDGRQRLWWQMAAVAACLLGAGCKETVTIAPLLVLLYDYTFVSRSQTKWSRPVFYLMLAAAAWIGPLTYARKIGAYLEGVRFISYALAEPAVVLRYLRLSVWPDDLFLYVNTTLFDVQSAAQVLVPAAVLFLLLVATVGCIARRHWLGFIGAWFFLTLAPTSSFVPISDVIQEHRMYLPLAALSALAVLAGELAVRRLTSRLSERERGTVNAALLAVVVLGLGIRTYLRNRDYHHEFAMIHPADLHEDYTILADHYLSKDGLIKAEANRERAMLRSADQDPRDVTFAHFIIGLADARAGKLQEAATELQRVLELEPEFAYADHQLGIVLRDLNDLPGAIEHFREAIRIKPNLIYAHKELAVSLAMAGDTDGAEQHLNLALRIQPRFGEALFELGILALRRGNTQEAAKLFHRALRNRPDLVEPHYELGMLRMEEGKEERARRHLAAAVRLRPDFAEAHKALGMMLARLGRREEARRHFERAIDLQPDYADAHGELAIVLRQDGDLAAAAKHLARAIELQPESADFHYQLGRLFVEKRERVRAIAEFQIALARNPDHFEANKDLGDALAERGELSAALPYLQRAVDLRPDDPDAGRRLGNLRKQIAGSTSPTGRAP